MRSYTKRERQHHIEEWEKGFLSKTAYAKSAGIMPTTFYNWFKGSNKYEQDFVEIHQDKLLCNRQEIIIEKSGIIIRVPLSSGIKELRTIFESLGVVQ
jgi:hypothetical protein